MEYLVIAVFIALYLILTFLLLTNKSPHRRLKDMEERLDRMERRLDSFMANMIPNSSERE